MEKSQEQLEAMREGALERYNRLWDRYISHWPRSPREDVELELAYQTVEHVEKQLQAIGGR